MTTSHNTEFYTDQVELIGNTNADVLDSLLKGMTTPLSFYVSGLEEHLAAIKLLAEANADVKDARVSWDVKFATTLNKIRVRGTRSWTQSKIDEFEGSMKKEKEEIDQLRLLIAKYPGKAVDALGYMLEKQKGESQEVK